MPPPLTILTVVAASKGLWALAVRRKKLSKNHKQKSMAVVLKVTVQRTWYSRNNTWRLPVIGQAEKKIETPGQIYIPMTGLHLDQKIDLQKIQLGSDCAAEVLASRYEVGTLFLFSVEGGMEIEDWLDDCFAGLNEWWLMHKQWWDSCWTMGTFVMTTSGNFSIEASRVNETLA